MAHNVITLIGMPGVGKTTFARKIWSYDHHHGSVTIASDPTLPGKDNLYNGIEDTDIRIRGAEFYSTREEVEKALDRGARTVVIRPRNAAEKHRVIAATAGLLSNPRPGAVYILDEAYHVVPNVAGRPGAPIGVEAVLEEARNYDIRVVLIAKHPQHLSMRARSYTTNLAVFHLDSKTSVKGLDGMVDPECARGVRKLPWGEYLYRPPFRDDDEAPLKKRHVLREPVPWPPYRRCGDSNCAPCARR